MVAKKPAANKASVAKKPAANKASVAKKPAANKASVAKEPAANKASASEEPLAGRLAPWTIGFLANYYRQRPPYDRSAEAPTRLAWMMRQPCTSTAVHSAEPVPSRGTSPAHTEEPSAGLFPLFRTLVVSANRSVACRAHAVHNA